MNEKLDSFRKFITQQLGEEGVRIAELLYIHYDSGAERRSEQAQASFRRIDSCIRELPFQQADKIREAAYLACGEYEKQAFLDGVAVGARLLLELTGQ